MTDKTPTTAECIEWLNSYINERNDDPISSSSFSKAIRAQLIAAQEMAKALKWFTEERNYQPYKCEGGPVIEVILNGPDMAQEALIAWQKAGGE